MKRTCPSLTPILAPALLSFSLVGCFHTAVSLGVAPAAGGVAGYYMTEPPEDPEESRLGNAWDNIVIGAIVGSVVNILGAMIIEDPEGGVGALVGIAEALTPQPAAPTTTGIPSSLRLMEDRTHCVLLETSGPRAGSPGYQNFGWTFTNSCVDAVTIIYSERFSDDDTWATRGTRDMDPGQRSSNFQGIWAEENGGPVVPRPLVVHCAASKLSVADLGPNYRALRECVDRKRNRF